MDEQAIFEPSDETMPPKLEEGSEPERIQIVAPHSWVRRVNRWRGLQDPPLNLSAAIRRLVEIALDYLGVEQPK